MSSSKKGKGTSLSFKESHNTGLLITKGNVTINNSEKAPTNHFVLFEQQRLRIYNKS